LHEGANLTRKLGAFLLFGLIAASAVGGSSHGQSRLAINELYACEIVLHELVADLTKLRAAAKRAATATTDQDGGNEAVRLLPSVAALDEAIALAIGKYDRCP